MVRRYDHHQWTVAECDRLVELYEVEGREWPDIARELKIATPACRAKFEYMMRFSARGFADYSMREKCPDEVLAERDRRMAAKHARDDFAAAHGDCSFLIGDIPPPGYSALDKRRAGV